MDTNSLHLITPLYDDLVASRKTGRRITLKMECFQPSGSFKLRGIGLLCQRSVAIGRKSLVSSSGGNAGLATAYAGRRLGVGVTVVVPTTTADATRRALVDEQARVIVHGDVWDEADVHARSLAEESNAAYIHPFDDPALWEGHATMIDEVVVQGPRPDAIVLSVGGGGLMCGVLEGLKRNYWKNVPVIAVETAGAESFYASAQAGRVVSLPAITSIAKSLGARKVAARAFEWLSEHSIKPIVVSDQEAVAACIEFAENRRILVEPACGAALAVAYRNHAALGDAKSVMVVVCGGVSTGLDMLKCWNSTLSI